MKAEENETIQSVQKSSFNRVYLKCSALKHFHVVDPHHHVVEVWRWGENNTDYRFQVRCFIHVAHS